MTKHEASNDLIGCSETLVDLVAAGASPEDLRRYIVVTLQAAIEEVKRMEAAAC